MPKRAKLTPYIIQYKCGCTDEARRKRDLLDYCGIHGDDVQILYPPMPVEETTIHTQKRKHA